MTKPMQLSARLKSCPDTELSQRRGEFFGPLRRLPHLKTHNLGGCRRARYSGWLERFSPPSYQPSSWFSHSREGPSCVSSLRLASQVVEGIANFLLRGGLYEAPSDGGQHAADFHIAGKANQGSRIGGLKFDGATTFHKTHGGFGMGGEAITFLGHNVGKRHIPLERALDRTDSRFDDGAVGIFSRRFQSFAAGQGSLQNPRVHQLAPHHRDRCGDAIAAFYLHLRRAPSTPERPTPGRSRDPGAACSRARRVNTRAR